MTDADTSQELYVNRVNSKIDYAKWEYAGASEVYNSISNMIDLNNKKVLEIGCGFGGMSVYFAQKGIDLIAIDNEADNSNAIEIAKEFALLNKIKVDFRFGNAKRLDFIDETFDFVIMEAVFEHIRNTYQVLKEIKRVLKPGGKVYNRFSLYYGPYGNHLNNFTKFPWIHLVPFLNLRKYILSKSKGDSKEKYATVAHDFEIYESLNKITLFETRRMLKKTGFKTIYLKKTYYDLGIGLWSSIRERSFFPLISKFSKCLIHPFGLLDLVWKSMLNILIFIPLIGEYFLTFVTVVFEKWQDEDIAN